MLKTIIIVLMWVAMSTLIILPHIKTIAEMDNNEKKILSCILFAVGGPAVLVSSCVMQLLDLIGDFDWDGNNDLWS